MERYAHQIAEMPADELQKRWQKYQYEESKRMRVKRINLGDVFVFVPPERERKE